LFSNNKIIFQTKKKNSKPKENKKSTLKRANSSKELQCKKCQLGFTTKENLSFHIKWVHGYSCDFCNYKCNFRSNLQRHIIGQHLGRKKLQCKICNLYLASDTNLNNHLRVVHHTENKYECLYCTKDFKSKTCLKNHIKFVHTGIRPHQCNQCEKKFKSKRDLNHHKKVHIKALIYSFPCQQCKKSFKNASELAFHINIVHSNERRFKCNVCNARFKTNVNLKTHIKNDSCKTYKCTFCSNVFKFESELKYHERWHIGNIDADQVHLLLEKEPEEEVQNIPTVLIINNNCSQVICDICNIKFNNNNILSKHMAAVHKEFPYKCQNCKQTFELEPVFFHHLTSHDSVKKTFNCIKCFRVFKSDKNLNKHLSKNVQNNDVCSKL
jgi:KRAB domain-containing zinc finger protein